MAMKKLSTDLQCLMSSSLQINSFKRVVEELVYNSLDAKATSIAVRVHIAENKIQVVDNGCGITESDFDLLGKKYSTSKCVDLNTLKSVPHTYGYRGQFLANLINIAQKVKIISRFEKGEDTWVKIFYNGKERELAKTTKRPSVGTTIEVNALFYNLHIQSKNIESLNELTEIKTFLKQLTLVHSNISISLRDDSKNEIIFKAQKNRNIYQTFALLFNIDEKDIVELKVEKKEYKVTAYFGKKDKDVGQYHWIYLNGKFLNNCKLYKIVNDNLSKSCKLISKRKLKTKIGDEEDIFTKMNIPFYILLLSCPYYDYDIHDKSKHTTIEFKNWQDITNLIKKVVMFYSEDDTLKKQLKHETVKNCYTKPKEDNMREQVRKIVEKLLKSNSKKLGVSQMQNGIKGKLTKRNKKKKSLNISLSKVIPSKNKRNRTQNKHLKYKSKIVSSNDEIVPESSKIQNVITQNINKESHKDIKEKHFINENLDNIETKSYKEVKEQSNACKKNDISIKANISPKEQFEHFRKEENQKRPHNSSFQINDCNISFEKGQRKTKKRKITNFIENKNYKTNNNYEREKILKENDDTTICTMNNNNKQITIRKKIEEIIVYDYIPHPLNSTQHSDYNQSQLTKKPHISSRDLVNTILNTQYNNISTNKNISLHHEEKYEPKKSKLCLDFANDNTAYHHIEQERIKQSKTNHESTVNAWNFDLQSNSNILNKLTDDMFVSKMTFESHHYNRNIFDVNGLKTKSNNFISKQSKENFIVSKDKHKKKKNIRNKYKHPPKINFPNANMSFGVKNFFKNRNFLHESSLMIEFSNTSFNGSDKYLQKNKNIFPTNNNIFCANFNKWMHKYNRNEQCIKGYSVNSEVKNTYTISESSSNTRDRYDATCQNYESIRYTENVLQGTYTIETQNNEESFFWKNNDKDEYDGEFIKETGKNEKDGLNVVFVSEPRIEIVETSADKVIEPICICETVIDESNSSKSLSNMVINLNHDASQISLMSRQEQHIETPKIREVSHHFNTTISNYTTAPNLSQRTHMEINAVRSNSGDINNVDITNESHVKSSVMEGQHKSNYVNRKIPEDTSNNFSIKIRPRYMPKGMSQIFENSNTKGVCDYKFDEEYYECNIFKDFTDEVQVNTDIFKPRIQNATEEATKAIEKVHSRLHKENSSLTFDGKLLKQAQILKQVDGKFIAAIVKSKIEGKDFLVLFDQHAVHERIRLENNMLDYLKDQEWKSVKLDVFVLKLSKDQILYLHNYKEKFTQLGLEWNILSDNEVSVFGIPEAILGKNSRQVEKVITAVKNLILEEINVIKSQGCTISLYPKSIMDLVFSEACRYAIKFGDKLTIDDCRELIQSLSDCRTPFQCAHGRPVMAVLMEMTSRDVQEYKIDLSKVRLFSKTKR